MGWTRRCRWVVPLVVVVVAGACGDDAGPSVIPSAAGPSGTALGDGFEVVEGTTLIGDPVPLGLLAEVDGEPIVDEGWVATSIIDEGGPMDIVEAYADQAASLGLVALHEPGCDLDRDVVICSAAARSSDRSEPRSLVVEAVRGRRADVVSNHAVVRYGRSGWSWEGAPERRRPAGGGDLALPDVGRWPPLPGVGDPVGTAGETLRNVTVQEGSRLAGPPRLNLDDATGGVVAILEVTGEPRSVLDAYGGSEHHVQQVGDARVTTTRIEEAGGDHFTFTLVERPERPTWLAIEGSHD
jgi:hypothetical protein